MSSLVVDGFINKLPQFVSVLKSDDSVFHFSVSHDEKYWHGLYLEKQQTNYTETNNDLKNVS